jgi:hypothetical protein
VQATGTVPMVMTLLTYLMSQKMCSLADFFVSGNIFALEIPSAREW